jgi:hypothetical protein
VKTGPIRVRLRWSDGAVDTLPDPYGTWETLARPLEEIRFGGFAPDGSDRTFRFSGEIDNEGFVFFSEEAPSPKTCA